MKEQELREHATCSKCKKLIGHTGLPIFWTASFERHGILIDAVKRQDGLTALLGGNAMLAQAMGTDEKMTQLMASKSITLCETCALPIIELIEMCGGFDE